MLYVHQLTNTALYIPRNIVFPTFLTLVAHEFCPVCFLAFELQNDKDEHNIVVVFITACNMTGTKGCYWASWSETT